MIYYDFEAGNKAYKLRLNTRNIVALEKQLGGNPLSIFGDGSKLPTVSELVTVLWASLQHFHHGISINDAYDIFDKYLDDGHIMTDFFNVVIEVYKVSGLIQTEETEKN